MNLENVPYELIDKYLGGELAPDHEFVKMLEADQELAQEVEIQRIVLNSVIDHRLLEVKSKIERYRNISPKPSYKHWLKWIVPAFLVASVSVYFALKPSETETKEVQIVEEKNETPNEFVKNEENMPDLPIKKSGKTIANSTQNPSNETPTKNIETTEKEPVALINEPIILPNQHSAIVAQSTIEKPESLQVVAKPLPSDLCVGVLMKAIVTSEKACAGISNGAIHFESIKNGTAPFSYSIDNGHNWTSDKYISNLKSGQYQLMVKDANNCKTLVDNEFYVTSKTCTEIAHFHFNPTLENWEVPTQADKAGQLQIFDKMGKLIFQHSFHASEKVMWNGGSQNSQVLLPGTYVYTISYQDGNHDQGNVTITY